MQIECVDKLDASYQRTLESSCLRTALRIVLRGEVMALHDKRRWTPVCAGTTGEIA